MLPKNPSSYLDEIFKQKKIKTGKPKFYSIKNYEESI